jgi:autotransporter-associated beta strand protein
MSTYSYYNTSASQVFNGHAGEEDVYYYNLGSYSNPYFVGNDVINNFEQGLDRIVFTVSGNNSDHFIDYGLAPTYYIDAWHSGTNNIEHDYDLGVVSLNYASSNNSGGLPGGTSDSGNSDGSSGNSSDGTPSTEPPSGNGGTDTSGGVSDPAGELPNPGDTADNDGFVDFDENGHLIGEPEVNNNQSPSSSPDSSFVNQRFTVEFNGSTYTVEYDGQNTNITNDASGNGIYTGGGNRVEDILRSYAHAGAAVFTEDDGSSSGGSDSNGAPGSTTTSPDQSPDLFIDLTKGVSSSAFTGSLGGRVGVVISGTGTHELSGASTYTGGTFLTGGTLVAGNTQAFGSGTVHTIDPTIQFSVSGTYANLFSLDVSAVASGASHTTANDPTIFQVAAGITATLSGNVISGSGTNLLGYAIDQSQPLVVAGLGVGATLSLMGHNSYSGGTTLTGNVTLDLASATSLDSSGHILTGAAGTGNISFSDLSQTLKIEAVALGSDSTHTFANHITGFAYGDKIDLVGIGTASSVSYDTVAHTLSVSGENQVATLSIDAAPAGYKFSAFADGSGGTNIQLTAIQSNTFAFKLTDAHFDFSGGHDVLIAPDGTSIDVTSFHTLTFSDGSVTAHEGSSIVDALYYDVKNPDVWAAHVDPTTHYNQYGWHEGRNPNADFSTTGYLAANPDVAKANVNPLTHYDTYGWKEGRDPSANFDNELYLANNSDVKAAGVDPLAHYLQYGQAEGRQAYAAIGTTASFTHGSFDAEYYLLANPDVAKAALAAGGDTFAFAFQHFQNYGAKEGRAADAFFDSAYYLAHNPDVAAAGMNPLTHYDLYGWKEGRDPSAAFDTHAYLAANPDVAAAHIDPLTHYLQFGVHEGRHLA